MLVILKEKGIRINQRRWEYYLNLNEKNQKLKNRLNF